MSEVDLAQLCLETQWTPSQIKAEDWVSVETIRLIVAARARKQAEDAAKRKRSTPRPTR